MFIARASMRHGGRCRLVDQPAGLEPLERERGVDPVRLVTRDRMRKDMADPGVALKPPVPQPQLT
jgi:hypothetical protein